MTTHPEMNNPDYRCIWVFDYLGLCMPKADMSDVPTWVHEFSEEAMISLLAFGFGIPNNPYHFISGHNGSYYTYTTSISHICAALTGISILDGSLIDGNQFWQVLYGSISRKEYNRRMLWFC
jgi:hypothetical protein